MIKIIESEARTGRLRLFAEIYQAKVAAKPFMEIIARYDAMSEAKLEVGEREFAENTIDAGKFDTLLNPEPPLPQLLKSVS